ncbi:MAG: hypothetical protein V4618_12925 [Pseudomonadota bacterium]
MRKLWIFGLPAVLALSAQTMAQPRYSTGIETKVEWKTTVRKPRHTISRATAGEPKARIRQAKRGEGLTPLAFARWMAGNSRFALSGQPSVRLASSPTQLLNQSATYFAVADSDGDGRVSAAELADFIDPDIRKRPLIWRV